MDSLLQVHELYKFHQQGGERVPVLRGVDLEVRPAEFVCVMGPSGSGKSTLLHLVAGLDEPSAGTIRLAGEELGSLSEGRRTLLRRSKVGFVFQFFNLLPNLSVRENVGLPIAIRGRHPEREAQVVEAIARELEIADRLDAFPHELSGGQMQRVSIARALIGGQPLLLCDEPTGNLSQKAGAEVMEILSHLVREAEGHEERAVLLVTHNPRDAAFADRVHFLVDGALDPDVVLRGPDLSVERVHEALTGLAI
jgi:putative ABC transport system ATP-binding protein